MRKFKTEESSGVIDILQDAHDFISENKIDSDISLSSLSSILVEEIKSPNNFTVSLHYDRESNEIVMAVKGTTPSIVATKATGEEYLELCKSIGVVDKKDFNLSLSKKFGGITARIFAITQPISEYPNITISSVKAPPTVWDNPEIDRIIKEHLAKSNKGFLLIGGSGAGKTYFMNYLLKELHGDTEDKVALVEEFAEIIAPNKTTSRLIVPAVKPGEERLLKYIAEQSNLMRLDSLYIGEIKGAEAWPFLMNLSSGTRGGATIHGENIRAGLKRFEGLAQLDEAAPEAIVSDMISKSIEYVIYLENRRIRAISRLTGVVTKGNYGLEDIYIE